MDYTALLSQIIVAAAALTSVAGCSGASASSSGTSTGCEVAFSNVQAAGVTVNTAGFHDDGAIELAWNPKLKHVDVLGGDVKDHPLRAFEADLYANVPIVDGAQFALLAVDPTDPALPVPSLTLVNGDAPKLTATGGTVHFTTASSTRLVFTINDATMVALDENRKVISGAPTMTMAMTCNLPATQDP